jgi:pSer/pThr/pTyr-binding forkhead associated (FHA) protein
VSITDLNSTNGTFLDDRRLADTMPLRHGALLRIGSYVLTCEHRSATDAEAADSTQRRSIDRVTRASC